MNDLGAAARVQAAFELSPSILAISDLESGRLLEVNEAFLRITGWSREEIIGRPIPDIGLWIDPAAREAGLATLRGGGAVRDFEARFRTKSGDEVVALAYADLLVVDGRKCVLTSLMDITARVRAQAALRESEERFAQLFHANPVPMTIVRVSDGRTIEANAAALAITGFARHEVIGRTTPDLGVWAEPAEHDRLAQELVRDGGVRDFEMSLRTRHGDVRQMVVSADVITYAGEPAVLNVVVDITRRKQSEAEHAARRAEAETLTRAKDEFLAMLGHELRNPLGTITNALAVMRRRASDPELARLVALIGRQAVHLTRLVDDLLDVARVTEGKVDLRRQRVDLREIARRCVDALAHAGRTASHRVTAEGDAAEVFGDPARLEQVVSNLVDNALKYTPPGGSVVVRVGTEGEHAVLRVRDTGEGIRPELLADIFDVFVQQPQALDRARGGLGLGLALVKRFVELHGGSVTAASAGPGAGSEFTVRLPRSTGETPAVPVGPAVSGSRRRRRILVVEDNADARESLETLLTIEGHEVATAADGPSAVTLAASFLPDVALVDVGLPGLDGYDVARALRRAPANRHVRLVALTGYGQSEDRRKALDAGFDIHMTKPVDPDVLARLLDVA
jgi:PAS domain S-box-containing protein